MKSCAIVLGGPFSSLKYIEKSDFVVACDKGYEYLKFSNSGILMIVLSKLEA